MTSKRQKKKKSAWPPVSKILAGAGLALASVMVAGAMIYNAAQGTQAPRPAPRNVSTPKLQTNQKFIEELAKRSDFAIEDMEASFRYIFSSLPDAVHIYPTENYYYFSFYHGGIEYAGNLRLAAIDRDKGILHFAYFAAANVSSSDGEMHYKKLTASDGVIVEKISALEYRVSFGAKQVTFHLNDLGDVEPPKGLLAENEIYIGPVFDESGIQMYLLFNTRFNIFHYILNDTWGAGDEFIASEISDRIVIGKRSGFAFYKDHTIDRKILIGVHVANVVMNNYYDGPFDQLPDNFIKGDMLKKAIEASDPQMAGKIDNFGYLNSGEGRYLIGPYIQYSQPSDMKMFDDCATNKEMQQQYARCFSTAGG